MFDHCMVPSENISDYIIHMIYSALSVNFFFDLFFHSMFSVVLVAINDLIVANYVDQKQVNKSSNLKDLLKKKISRISQKLTWISSGFSWKKINE